MKNLLISCCIVLSITSKAQKSYVKEVELAENHFALESQIIGVKEGFLKNMDTSAVGLESSGFVKMYPSWTKRAPVSSTLIWEPKSVFASENGLWGSTHGPWYTKDSTGKLINPGYFFTIWQRKNINESYKFSLDMGIQLSRIFTAKEAPQLPLHSFSFKGKLSKKVFAAPSDFFSISSAKSLAEALLEYSGSETALLVSGSGRITRSEIEKVNAFTKSFQFSRIDSFELEKGIAFYEYGTIKFTSEKEKTGQYVHVWVNQNGKPLLLTGFYKWD